MLEYQLRGWHIVRYAAAPEVFGGGAQLLIALVGKLGIERRLAIKGVIAQQALSEAVDGINRGGIELGGGGF